MKQVMEADVGGCGAQQCLSGGCHSAERHWEEGPSGGLGRGWAAHTGVDVAKSVRVRGRGDQGLELGRSPAQAGPPCTKPEDLVPSSSGVAFLTSPSLCFIIGNTCRAPAAPFRVSGVGLRGWGDAGPAHTEVWQVGAQSQGVITAIPVLAIGMTVSSDSSLWPGVLPCPYTTKETLCVHDRI